ncbi:MAG: CoA transferase, partial [Novosphingobium sp.]
MPADRLTIPLARWADRELAQFAETTGVPAVPRGGTLLGERAALNRFAVPGQRSAGGGCLLLPARNGWIAINLAREDDRSLLPALFETETAIDDEAIALCVAASDADRLVARGREMGLAIAALCEPEAPPAAVEVLQTG